MKNLYLQLNSNNGKGLASLVSLLLKYDFILFWQLFQGRF